MTTHHDDFRPMNTFAGYLLLRLSSCSQDQKALHGNLTNEFQKSYFLAVPFLVIRWHCLRLITRPPKYLSRIHSGCHRSSTRGVPVRLISLTLGSQQKGAPCHQVASATASSRKKAVHVFGSLRVLCKICHLKRISLKVEQESIINVWIHVEFQGVCHAPFASYSDRQERPTPALFSRSLQRPGVDHIRQHLRAPRLLHIHRAYDTDPANRSLP